MNERKLQELKDLIASGNQDEFYNWQEWRNLRARVYAMDNHECQMCKARGRYRHGDVVHHVKHLVDRPDLALSINDPVTGERQLVTICKRCHEAEHPDALRPYKSAPPVSEERWD